MAEMTANSPRVIQNYSNAERLVIVPGHAIYKGIAASDFKLDEYWVGGFPKQAKLYAEHTFAGIECSLNSKTLLVFSGGQTRTEVAGTDTEAQSYYRGADQNNFLYKPGVKERSRVEMFARDSFENVAFSIGVFVMNTGHIPSEIITCAFGFKKYRFMDHAEVLGIKSIMHYESVNNPEGSLDDPKSQLSMATIGEAKTRKDFEACPLGDHGVLLEKKYGRDLHLRGDAAYRYYNLDEIFAVMRK